MDEQPGEALFEGRRHRLDRQDRPDFVVDEHHGEEEGVRIDRVEEILRVEVSIWPGGDPFDSVAALLQRVDGAGDGRMLDSGGDHRLPRAGIGRGGPEDRKIVALGGAAGKGDAVRLAAEHPGGLAAGCGDKRLRLHPLFVKGGRVAVIGGHRFHAGLRRLRADPGGRAVIEIDFQMKGS